MFPTIKRRSCIVRVSPSTFRGRTRSGLGKGWRQLSENQIRDCFRAAGYSPEEVDGYTKVVQERIAELNAL